MKHKKTFLFKKMWLYVFSIVFILLALSPSFYNTVINISAVTSCQTSTTSWQNFTIPTHTDSFTIDFDAKPDMNPTNMVVGLSAGPGAIYKDFAVLIRFAPSGVIDAFNGPDYQADTVLSYQAGKTYHFKVIINVPSRTYTIFVTPSGTTTPVTIGTNYQFRVDQNTSTSINNWGIINTANIGATSVCNFTINGNATTPSITRVVVCPMKSQGDADCKKDINNKDISLSDFEVWRKEFYAQCSQSNLSACSPDEDNDGSPMDANFNYPGSGNLPNDSSQIVNMTDFEIWRKGYFSTINISPTITITPSPTRIITSPTPSSIPTIITTVTPTPTITSGSHTYIWISPQEISTLPMSGAAWTAIKTIADGSLGMANISDQDSYHPESTYATALVAVRTGDPTYKSKAVGALMSAIGTENNPDADCVDGTQLGARSMSLGRNLIAYIAAADVLNFRTGGYDPAGNGTTFQNWVNSVRFRKNCPNNAGGPQEDLSQTHDGASSNGNQMAGASRIAAAAYLGDTSELDKAWLTFRRYAGDRTVGPALAYNSFAQTWAADLSANIGINPKGATKNGVRIDGVIPNDQGRGGDFMMPPGYTQYPWEGLQGAYAQAVILDRFGYKDPSGKNPWHVSDDALFRAVDYQWYLQQQYGGLWFDSTRAAWVKHLANKIYGKNYSVSPSGGGRNMDFTQWTHQ